MPRTATAKLSTMTIDALLQLRSQIDHQLAEHRQNLQAQLSRLTGTASITSSSPSRPSNKGLKIAPKYRGPKGEAWAGRGLRPRWLAALIRQRHKLEEYAVATQAASRKKTFTKRSRRKLSKRVERTVGRRR
jgi:DNA-binding protein H-NS